MFRLVLSDGVRMIVVGLAIGLAGMLLVARWIEGLLYQVRPLDAQIIAEVAGILVVVAIVATVLPARRAAKVNPTEAIN